MSADKETTYHIVVGAVIALLLLGVAWRFTLKAKNPQLEAEPVGKSEKIKYSLADKKNNYDPNNRSYKQQRLNASSVVLEGIAMNPVQTAAFNDKDYHIGDIVYGYKILDIRENEVVIDKKGVTKYIKMGETLDKL